MDDFQHLVQNALAGAAERLRASHQRRASERDAIAAALDSPAAKLAALRDPTLGPRLDTAKLALEAEAQSAAQAAAAFADAAKAMLTHLAKFAEVTKGFKRI